MLIGCAETRIYENGEMVCCIQGDAENVTLKTYRGGTFHADRLTHSSATAAAYTGATAAVGAIASGVVSAAAVIR